MKIERLSDTSLPSQNIDDGIKSVFFATSSRQEFLNSEVKSDFYVSWTKFYLDNFSDQIWLLINNDSVVGYLMGCSSSLDALEWFRSRVKSYSLFSDLFEKFPAHFHINLLAEARGHRFGEKLVDSYLQQLCSLNLGGVHIVTSEDARNQHFYRRLGFYETVVREFNGQSLLFMGKSLT